MATIAVADLEASLSAYLSRVRQGETVVLTESGIPFAKLAPLPSVEDGDECLASLIREGLVLPPERPQSKTLLDRFPVIDDPEGSILKGLLDDRENGW